jgi:hypothetical protein
MRNSLRNKCLFYDCRVKNGIFYELGNGPVGEYSFSLNVANKGLATFSSPATYTYALTASSISPLTGGTGGKCKKKLN